MTTALRKRSEVPEEMTWDARSVFPSDEAWEAAVNETTARFSDLEKYSGRLGESADTLLEALTARDDLGVRVFHTYQYAGMYHYGDMNDQEAIARFGRAVGLFGRFAAASAFYEPEILSLDPTRLQAMQDESEGLRAYAHYFNKLARRREHVRSAEVEEVLADVLELANMGERIHGALADSDLKFGKINDPEGREVELGQGNIETLIRNRDRAVRKAAWEAQADAYISMKNTFAAALGVGVKRDVFYARARKYANSLESALGATNIPIEVFHTTIDTFKRMLPLWHRYWEIKRRGLGVDKLHGYDVDVPLVRSQRKIPYEEGMRMVVNGLAPLGEEYAAPMKRGLYEERWVDVLPNEGKAGGAFSSGAPGTHPFLLLSYDDTLENVSTLAHEMGHSMHSYFAWDTQPPIYSNYSMFVAETASNFNQALMRADLLSKTDDTDFELEILAEAMSNFHRYLFIMPTLARFELEVHEREERGEGVTAESMSKLMADLYREAYGPAVEVDDARVGITWAEFPHLFGNFYVFQYTTGISAANALADQVLKEGRPAVDRYLGFLKAGDAMYPIDALKLAGIDMTTPEPLERAFGILERMVNRLDELVGQGPL
ncbi:MAG: oligoendopeptidase F [Chloroflexia bacterium]